MISSIEGMLSLKGERGVVVEVGGVGFMVFTSARVIRALPAAGSKVKFFSHLHVRENAIELYGFPSRPELEFFEALISVSGVGPKSALAILGVDKFENIAAAIREGRPDLLTRASGIGRKIGERIVLELRTKVSSVESESFVGKMEADTDLIETLASLGYRKEQAKSALEKVDGKIKGLEDRLKAALKILGGKG